MIVSLEPNRPDQFDMDDVSRLSPARARVLARLTRQRRLGRVPVSYLATHATLAVLLGQGMPPAVVAARTGLALGVVSAFAAELADTQGARVPVSVPALPR